MDRGREADSVLEEEERPETHRVLFWPEPLERPDALIANTSQIAAS